MSGQDDANDARPSGTAPGENPISGSNLPSLPVAYASRLPAVPLFHELEAASHTVLARINVLPAVERKRERQRLRNVATGLRREAKANANRALFSNTMGGVLGGGLLTGSIVLLATAPISLPLAFIAISGAAALACGLGVGYKVSANGIEQEHRAEIIDNVIEEIDL